MDRLYSVRKENAAYYYLLANLKTKEGKIALKPAHLKILEYIGSFEDGKGCFAGKAKMNQETINSSHKTFVWHLEYLLYIGAIIKSQNGRKTVYKLDHAPKTAISQREFRQNIKHLPSYRYGKTAQCEPNTTIEPAEVIEPQNSVSITEPCIIEPAECEVAMEPKLEPTQQETVLHEVKIEPTKQPNFLSKTAENFSLNGDIFSTKRENFSPLLENCCYKTKKNSSLKSPLVHHEIAFEQPTENLNEVQTALRAAEVAPKAQPEERLSAFPTDIKNFSKDLKDQSPEDDWSEPLLEKKRIHKPKNERERRAEAVQLINNGHIVNPLGIRDNRKKQLNWKLARDFGESGSVTVPQLWRHLVKLWNNSFGEGTCELMLSCDKSAMAMEFDRIRQQFVTNCQYEPDNRELASYFEWFLDPKRLARVRSLTKDFHFRQLSGGVYIKRFFDEVLSKKIKDKQDIQATVSPAQEQSSLVENIFAELRDSYQDNYKFALRMVQNGYALTAQFLYDELNFDESQCRQRIIKVMVEFIKTVENHQEAVNYLKKGFKTTKEHAPLLRQESCIWFDWEEKTKDLVQVAIEQSGLELNYE